MPFFKRDKKPKSKPSSRASSQNNSRNDEETERDNPMEGYKLTLARSNDSMNSEQSSSTVHVDANSPPLSPHKEHGGIGKLVRRASHKLLKFNKTPSSSEEGSNSKREDDRQNENTAATDMNPNEVKEAIFSVQTQFFFDEKLYNVYHAILSNFLTLTKSAYGFMGEVKFKHDKPYVQLRITILKNEDGSLTKKKIKVNYDKFYKTVWGYAILNKLMLVASDPNDPRGSLTLPVSESHVSEVRSLLAVPFCTTPSKRSKSVKVLAVATVCNRPGGYSQQHLETLQPFAKTCSNLLEAHSNHQVLKDQEGVSSKSKKKHSRSRSVSLDDEENSRSSDEAPTVILRDNPKRHSSRPSSESFPPLKDSPSPTSSSPIGSITNTMSSFTSSTSPSSGRSQISYSRASSYHGSANNSVVSTPKSSPPNSPSTERHSTGSSTPPSTPRPGLQRTLSEKTMKPEKEHHHHKEHKEESSRTHKGRTNSLAFIFNPYLTAVSPLSKRDRDQVHPTKKRSASLPPNSPESPSSSSSPTHSLRQNSKFIEIDLQHFAIKRKNELVNSQSKTTFEFLRDCVVNRDAKELAKLLKIKKFHPHVNDHDMDTLSADALIHIAVKLEDFETIELLLQYGANPNVKNASGNTPLHLAVQQLNARVMMSLLQADGVDPNILNKKGCSAFLDFCNTWDSPNSLRKMFDAFLARKADLTAYDRNGETALHKAILNPMMRVMIVKLLIEHSSNVNLTNTDGETPLHYAVRINRKEIVDDLLAAGADLNITNKHGKTAINIADEVECTNEIKLKLKNTQDLTLWFNKIGLPQYVPLFLKENIFTDLFPFLTERILKELGISQAGDRIRILAEIDQARQQQQAPQTPPPTATEGASAPSGAATGLKLDLEPPARPRASSRQRPIRRKPETIPPFPSAVEELKKELEADTKWIKYTDLEFTQQLSAGSSGKVYKGYFNGAIVAIKVLEKTKEEEQIEEFKYEFKVFSAVRSPNVVQFFGASLEPRVCLVMEYCSRGSVHDILNDTVPFGWKQLLGFAIQMTMGIQCLHNCKPNQILHRDVKCMNFLVSENWCIKVCDFGLARSRTPSGNSTLKKLRGTTTHISPETCKGEEFTSKSDIFSLGICFWELAYTCITGKYQRPYSEFHLEPLQIVMQNPTGLRPTIPENCPSKVAELIRMCWDGEPTERPTCEVVLQKLQECLKDMEQNPQAWLDSENKRSLGTSEEQEANSNNNNVVNETNESGSSGSRGSNRSSDGNSELSKLRKLVEQTEGSLAFPAEQTTDAIPQLPVVQV